MVHVRLPFPQQTLLSRVLVIKHVISATESVPRRTSLNCAKRLLEPRGPLGPREAMVRKMDRRARDAPSYGEDRIGKTDTSADVSRLSVIESASGLLVGLLEWTAILVKLRE